jgi:hypothetical protein
MLSASAASFPRKTLMTMLELEAAGFCRILAKDCLDLSKNPLRHIGRCAMM